MITTPTTPGHAATRRKITESAPEWLRRGSTVKKAIRSYPVLWFGVLVGVVTGALSIIFKIDGPAAVILILTQLV
jgi:hypothetical protein